MEAEYEQECRRAELLGLPKPTLEEFLKSSGCRARREEEMEAEETKTTERVENLSARKEKLRRIGGGLEELNSLLLSTQKKLDRFRTVCSNFSNSLKGHITAKKEDGKGQLSNPDSETKIEKSEEASTEEEKMQLVPIVHVTQETKKEAKSNVDKLDSIISKAERAELSLSSQNKQIKKFLNQ